MDFQNGSRITDLKELLTSYGDVLVANMVKPQYFASYRYGLVEMATMAEAEGARQALNRTRGDGHLILVIHSFR
jgi:hypothetical protein